MKAITVTRKPCFGDFDKPVYCVYKEDKEFGEEYNTVYKDKYGFHYITYDQFFNEGQALFQALKDFKKDDEAEASKQCWFDDLGKVKL